jgi:hypothetical protein
MPLAFVVTGFASLPIYQKPPNQVTESEMWWTNTTEESYQLVSNRDYIGFALYLMRGGIGPAIGAALATSWVDVARDRKKNKKD